MTRDTDKRCVKTKRAIKTAFLIILAEKKYEDITVSEIAETAEINRKTFYAHYSGVFDVLDEIEEDSVNRTSEFIKSVDFDKLIESPEPILAEIVKVIDSDIWYYEQIVCSMSKETIGRKIKEKIISNVVDAYAGLFPDKPRKFRDCVEFIAGGIIAVYMKWIEDKKSESLEELCGNIASLLIDGAKNLLADS